ncbi:putative phytol kinase 3, chloroplastic [Morella rubra]|uniref:Putative phytol kinase 3, chloroplastic n=1 Tax=Morella rubra TaxID=262757 RepID=A0A6A1WSG3_9ROSI|nr:putative phytol kinase 3, chloroplastic [Morella rubra]
MAATHVPIFLLHRADSFQFDPLLPRSFFRPIPNTPSSSLSAAHRHSAISFGSRLGATIAPNRNRKPPASTMALGNPLVSDICATALTGSIALFLLRFWGEIAKQGFLHQTLNRKLVHVSIGLVFMLCWPLFSSGHQGAILAALVPGINIIAMLLLGFGIMKDEAMVKSMSRSGNYRELLKGPLYYAATITLACIIYWRTSPISIAAICNLCAGDGFADIIGRRFGSCKLPYNRNKSVVGSAAMAAASLLASIGYMYYFSSFGFVQASWEMFMGFLVVTLASTLVESLPISTDIDDNLTVPLTSILVGTLVSDSRSWELLALISCRAVKSLL